MTVHLNPSGGQFTVKDFTPLEDHYTEQTIQTHVMTAYTEKGLAAMEQAAAAVRGLLRNGAQAMIAIDELVRLSRLDPEWSWAGAAVIARDWRRLAPVRAYPETLGIPVEMANESLPSIWRLRKMHVC